MNRNLESPTRLTEFAPLSPEPSQPGIGLFLSKIFTFSKGSSPSETPVATGEGASAGSGGSSSSSSVGGSAGGDSSSSSGGSGLEGRDQSPTTDAWPSADTATLASSIAGSEAAPYDVDMADGRSLPNVLKRISNLLALKSSGLQAYKDTDFKQYWMPDAVSRECYECGERFTTFRRRHHCRVCGQIFCSRCCNQEIPGKIMGCTGDLRVCTYCCKVVLSYLQSADMGADLSADLRSLQEDLQTKFGNGGSLGASGGGPGGGGGGAGAGPPSVGGGGAVGGGGGSAAPEGGGVEAAGAGAAATRRASAQEDRFAGRVAGAVPPAVPTAPPSGAAGGMSAEERGRALQRSASLRALHDQLTRGASALPLHTHRLRLRAHHACFQGADLVEWLQGRGHAASRVQGAAIGQALLDGGFIGSVAPADAATSGAFADGAALYRPLAAPPLPPPSPPPPGAPCNDVSRSGQWSGRDSLGTDSETECPDRCILDSHDDDYDEDVDGDDDGGEVDAFSLPSSSSTFYLDLNVESSTVSLRRPKEKGPQNGDGGGGAGDEGTASPSAAAPANGRPAPAAPAAPAPPAAAAAGAAGLAPDALPPSLLEPADAEEELARTRLQAAYAQHEAALLRQLLSAESLSQQWADVLLPLAASAAAATRPDANADGADMDIRRYVQFKKVAGGARSDCRLVGGLACTKNLAHRAMAHRIPHPRILCLGCAVVYQRVEGRLLSLEPVLMQERQYLHNVVARIEALRPSLVLARRGVSRLAQELLLASGVALALNVKASVLERVARCTGADVVNNVDAHVGRPRLGTCKLFHLHTFRTDTGASKTLMFFEGCAAPSLGSTVLLRGGPASELRRVKRVAQMLLFAHYSWRLELAFLLAEGARPPSPSREPGFVDDGDAALSPPGGGAERGEDARADEIGEAVISSTHRCPRGDTPSPCEEATALASPLASPMVSPVSPSGGEAPPAGPVSPLSPLDRSALQPESGSPMPVEKESPTATAHLEGSSPWPLQPIGASSPTSPSSPAEPPASALCGTPETSGMPRTTDASETTGTSGTISTAAAAEISGMVGTSEAPLTGKASGVAGITNASPTARTSEPLGMVAASEISPTAETSDSPALLTSLPRATPRLDKSPSEERRSTAAAECVSDFSDPLRCHLLSADEDGEGADGEGGDEGGGGAAGPGGAAGREASAQPLPVAELPLSNRFRKALDGTVLSASPYLQFSVPYLETEAGRSSALWRYFPREIFWSAQFSPSPPNSAAPAPPPPPPLAEPEGRAADVKLMPQHPFVTARLTAPASSREVQALLAHFRACGGRLLQPPPCPVPPNWPAPLVVGSPAPPAPPAAAAAPDAAAAAAAAAPAPEADSPAPAAPIAPTPPAPGWQDGWPDALDPRSHQHLAVLFCSYAHQSSNAPAFCVNPWVVHMDFYDASIDISLGGFLERYCFRPSYACPSPSCDAPMLEHVRRFVHDGGCLSVQLRELERPLPTPSDPECGSMLTWSWCTRCRSASAAAPLPLDARALSFAKFLELRFHAHAYRRRRTRPNAPAAPNAPNAQEASSASSAACPHSLHRDHVLCFGRRNVVATFQYNAVAQWEVALPPPLLLLGCEGGAGAGTGGEGPWGGGPGAEGARAARAAVIEELKRLALRGYELFTGAAERLAEPALAAEPETTAALRALLAREQAYYRQRIEEVQLKLTSPTLEARRQEGAGGEREVQRLMWLIEDAVVALKRLLADTVDNWNARLNEAAAAAAAARRKAGADDRAPGAAPAAPAARPRAPEAEGAREEDGSDVEATARGEPPAEGPEERPDAPCATQPAAQPAPPPPTIVEAPDPIPPPAVSAPAPTAPPPAASTSSSGAAEAADGKPAQKIVKSLLSQLLPSAGPVQPLQSPLSPLEHPLAGPGWHPPVVVYETEPSSVVACALGSPDYRRAMDELRRGAAVPSDQPSPSPQHKRRSTQSAGGSDAGAAGAAAGGAGAAAGAGGERGPGGSAGVLSFLRGAGGGGVQYHPAAPPPPEAAAPDEEPAAGNAARAKTAPVPHIEVQFSDGGSSFFCRVYFAEQFVALRAAVLPAGEEAFARSLARCVQWEARGGKSGSSFCKTKDDRFVLKEMSRLELQLFLDFAPHYFAHVHASLAAGAPTLLGKIVGVFRLKLRSAASAARASNLLVMENLFFRRRVSHKFDLKGSMRNRHVDPLPEHLATGELVLLDENLLKMTCDSPLYVYPHSKAVLMQAINSDTQFLASQAVMDYSLLVGLDTTRRELVVGIIDYIRTFTWDKKLEAMVKYYGHLGGGQAKLPTVVSPELYRTRFIAAMHRYFLPVPDRWTHLSRGLLDT